jgi:hypothetical protein
MILSDYHLAPKRRSRAAAASRGVGPDLAGRGLVRARLDRYVLFILVIGAVIFHLLQHYLADFGASCLILLDALGILIMLVAPRGLWGLVSERFDLTLFWTRRRLVTTERGEGG